VMESNLVWWILYLLYSCIHHYKRWNGELIKKVKRKKKHEDENEAGNKEKIRTHESIYLWV